MLTTLIPSLIWIIFSHLTWHVITSHYITRYHQTLKLTPNRFDGCRNLTSEQDAAYSKSEKSVTSKCLIFIFIFQMSTSTTTFSLLLYCSFDYAVDHLPSPCHLISKDKTSLLEQWFTWSLNHFFSSRSVPHRSSLLHIFYLSPTHPFSLNLFGTPIPLSVMVLDTFHSWSSARTPKHARCFLEEEAKMFSMKSRGI